MEGTMDRELVRSQKFIDDREPAIIRNKMMEIGWTQRRLYSADYAFWTVNYKKVGVERKSVSDLMGSLGDRLSNQLYKQLEYFDFSILLIEGSWKNVYAASVVSRDIQYYQWSTIWNFLRTWQDRGMTVELTTSEGHTIKRLNELYVYYMKESHAGGLRKGNVSGDPRLLALQCGGIGPKLGLALLEKFGSLKAIANANAEDFEAVNKIGHNKAIVLYSHFNKNGNNGDSAMLVNEETGEIV